MYIFIIIEEWDIFSSKLLLFYKSKINQVHFLCFTYQFRRKTWTCMYYDKKIHHSYTWKKILLLFLSFITDINITYVITPSSFFLFIYLLFYIFTQFFRVILIDIGYMYRLRISYFISNLCQNYKRKVISWKCTYLLTISCLFSIQTISQSICLLLSLYMSVFVLGHMYNWKGHQVYVQYLCEKKR